MGIKSNNLAAAFHDFFSRSGKDAVLPAPPPPSPITATGGDATSIPGDGYKYHYFTTVGPSSFVITQGNSNVEYIVIGGGGSGGGWGNGDTGHAGGGAGGLRTNFPGIQDAGSNSLTASDLVMGPGTYPTSVGAGGPGGAGGETGDAADDGDESSFGPPSTPARIIATGGGGGGCHGPNQPAGSTGGSGSVVIRYATADAPSNVTGGTKTTDGSDTVHTFNSSGTLTVAD